ncbi:pyridoxamine kinase [Faecalitalea cylindroides]|uniref:pyridoxamine kinase n=1 Tax=Faecalitalea cylindroides TaxID=39483 RepID=UPI001897BAB0|nr:pyridoxamine kinase [Faecalitalea cylindroides]MDB7946163.1 pyridoxamine kinase [Faecalitalea cylindroides]MDB7948179.1 pyridoxamine kinase [Faecalitalea cylindroides]MDB7949945.1 pyridoxamine kinase [Faecalitalea cylindroides]
MSHNNQKKIAVINDFSGFGRCSIAVALPIISTLKIQCCPLPTSIFSNHTGFDSFFFDDYTDKMPLYINEWKKLGLQFDGITSGFLGSKKQIEIVTQFFKDFKTKENIIIVDPVMGDYGKIYATYTKEMCEEMRKLVQYADIITPNITELCILTDTPYQEKWKISELEKMTEELAEKGPEKIVVTGIVQKEFIANFCYEKGKSPKILRCHRVGTQRSGTGDVFSSIIAADAVNQVPFDKSVKKASNFIKKCILKSIEMDIPVTDGVCFEELLQTLKV